MPDKLTPVDQVIREVRESASVPTPIHARYRPCKICGQSYDHAEPLLAAYHSIKKHKPMRGV